MQIWKALFSMVLCLFIAGNVSAKGNRVTAAQVADAVRNSPNASQWLRDNADAVGRLAMFESGGQLDIYNKVCCYGVLQMNTRNINDRGYTPEQFRRLPLQAQVDAWATIMSQALRTRNPRRLSQMEFFDGRRVTGEMVLACVQLGQGNCGTMLNSGRCGGFKDEFETSICHMADRITGGSGSSSTTPTDPSTPGGSYTGTGGIPEIFHIPAAYDGNFETGSGQSSEELRSTLQMILVGVGILVLLYVLGHSLVAYSNGQMSITHMKRVGIMCGIVFAMILYVATFM